MTLSYSYEFTNWRFKETIPKNLLDTKMYITIVLPTRFFVLLDTNNWIDSNYIA